MKSGGSISTRARQKGGGEEMAGYSKTDRTEADALVPNARGRSSGTHREMGGAKSVRCAHCGERFPLAAPGTRHRNHCPRCLWSVHLDVAPGDRGAGCGGLMEPIAVSAKRNGEWRILHQCRACGAIHANRIAGDDSEYALLALAARPMGRLPFPLP